MAGLIPLLLRPSSQNGQRSPSNEPSPRTSLRHGDTSHEQDMAYLLLGKASARSLRSRSLSPAPTPSNNMPRTHAEWKREIGGVKRLHITRRNKVCLARCTEILDAVEDPSRIEPVYLIYMHFYAALAAELCARPLTDLSPYRTTLLQQARSHLDDATKLIQTAEDSVTRKLRASSYSTLTTTTISSTSSAFTTTTTSSSSSAWASGTHSPTSSISSRSSSSPTNSICCIDDLSANGNVTPLRPPPPPKRDKKVSFTLPDSPAVTETLRGAAVPDVVIRPDSPTLGFDDQYFHTGAALQSLPPLPKAHVEVEVPLPPASTDAQEEEERDGEREADHEQEQQSQQDGNSSDGNSSTDFLAMRSVHRYHAHLRDLKTQLAQQTASLDATLSPRAATASPTFGGGGLGGLASAATDSPPYPYDHLPDLSAFPSRAASPALSVASCMSSASSSQSDLRALDRRARIERLRSVGWQRKRFDARRYEELADQALAELR